MNIFEGITPLEQGLNASWKRNSVTMDNVANADTPNFKGSKVEFETLYKQSLENEQSGMHLKRTRPTHMNIGTGEADAVEAVVTQNNNTTMRMDGNSVDIEKEMTELARNVIYYNTLTRKVTGQFSQLRMAIREGR